MRQAQEASVRNNYAFQTPGTLIQGNWAFKGPCDSPVGISGIAIVGVDDSHTSVKTDFTVHSKCTANSQIGRRAVLFLFRLTVCPSI
jgi:hypothetical protein